ncbi:uncharacterized protein LOC123681367 [Harmonia axyridis]|uniref:uncharacterized protein LOC123681367 n=1 Tax=Harmonia axyridis TaxID=115357 RepID=UPI001E27736A|nr:uncharacterized protein LOC123681367 [Harmonia axyridis]
MLGLSELALLSIPLFCIAMVKIVNYKPEPIFNVYQRPNSYYWIKVTIMFILLYVKQLVNKIIRALKDKDDLQKYHKELETNQNLSSHKQATNAVYFKGSSENGDHIIVAVTRRINKLVDSYIFLKINNENIGLLEGLQLPDTTSYQTESNTGFEVDGLSVQCLEPMKTWRIKYQGKMKKSKDPSIIFNVDLDVKYTSNLPLIDFETDIDPLTMAKCIALEKWNKEFFQLLKGNSQTLYEQHGNIEGYAAINGNTFDLDMYSSKNRSFGQQGEWRNVHKYNLHMFSTESGDRFTVGEYCFPLTLSSFKMGFVYSATDEKVYPITYNDFQLYQHGESGNPPSDYAFTIIAGGRTYTIKVDVIDSSHFYISKDWECKIIQRFCSFKVNSLKGWGTSECQQRNMLGRSIIQNNNGINSMANNTHSENNSKLLCGKYRSVCESKSQSENNIKIKIKTENRRQNNTELVINQELICEQCEKVCESRIEFWKHLRTHDAK